MAPHSSTLAWKIPWMEEPGRLQSMGSLGVGHDWATSLSLFTFMHWRRKWQSTPVFLPGESHGRRSLVGCSPWDRSESDTTEATQQQQLQQAFFIVQLSHPYMTTEKTIALTIWTFVSKVMSLLFKTLSRFIIAFLPRSKRLLISWLKSPSAVILEPKKVKSVIVSIVSPFICHEVMGPDAMILVFWMLSFKSAFSLSSFTFIKRLFRSSLLSAIKVVSSAYLRLLVVLAILIPVLLHPVQHFLWCTRHIN